MSESKESLPATIGRPLMTSNDILLPPWYFAQCRIVSSRSTRSAWSLSIRNEGEAPSARQMSTPCRVGLQPLETLGDQPHAAGFKGRCSRSRQGSGGSSDRIVGTVKFDIGTIPVMGGAFRGLGTPRGTLAVNSSGIGRPGCGRRERSTP